MRIVWQLVQKCVRFFKVLTQLPPLLPPGEAATAAAEKKFLKPDTLFRERFIGVIANPKPRYELDTFGLHTLFKGCKIL